MRCRNDDNDDERKKKKTNKNKQKNVKEAFDTAIWHALVSANEAQKPLFWKRLFCLT